MHANMSEFITTGFTIFIIIMNTFVQFFVSKKSIILYKIIWFRDILSILMFIYLGIYWQIWIVLWQFVLTYTGYLCWKHEEKTGNTIHQIDLIKMLWTKERE